MAQKVVLITGCSSGFGVLAAVEAARRGHQVIATMRNVAKRAALDAAASKAGVKLDVAVCDVDDAESMHACVVDILNRYGHIDVLVNNAGFGMGGAVYDLSMAELRAQMETNFFGAVALTKEVLPAMLQRKSGLIINVTSVAALHSAPGTGAYNASKRALEGLSEALRFETEPFGVYVTTVLPGVFKTEVFEKRHSAHAALSPESPYFALSQQISAFVDDRAANHGEDPKKVADVICNAIDARKPPLQVLVGVDARVQTWARKLLPERLWFAIVAKVMGVREPVGKTPR